MASDVSVGDAESPFLDVSPADSDTVATLTVRKPDGTSEAVTVAGGPLEPIPASAPTQYMQRWSADTPVVYDAAGRWVLHWEVTGTGEGAEDLEVYVVPSPTAGGPTWAPGRSRVAAYVPRRTLVRSLDSTVASADGYAWTFDSTTTPPGTSVDRLIADGVAWVSARVSPLHTSLHEAAAVCAALFAAAMIERSWPDDDQALQRANDLERRLDVLMADLIAANNAAGGTGDYGLDIAPMPVYNFAPADPRWDYPTYF